MSDQIEITAKLEHIIYQNGEGFIIASFFNENIKTFIGLGNIVNPTRDWNISCLAHGKRTINMAGSLLSSATKRLSRRTPKVFSGILSGLLGGWARQQHL